MSECPYGRVCDGYFMCLCADDIDLPERIDCFHPEWGWNKEIGGSDDVDEAAGSLETDQ